MVLSPVQTPPLWYCLLFRHHHCGIVSCSYTTIMVLSPVQTPPLWYCLLFRHHHYGTVSCSDTTIVVLSPVQTPPLWYCLLFRHHHYGNVSCSDTTIMVLSPVQTPPNKQHNVMQFHKLQNDNLPLLSCVLITLCMAPAGVLRSIAHSSVTSHSSPDPSPSPSVSTFSCKTKYQTTEGKISTRYTYTHHCVSTATSNNLKQTCKWPSAKLSRQTTEYRKELCCAMSHKQP